MKRIKKFMIGVAYGIVAILVAVVVIMAMIGIGSVIYYYTESKDLTIIGVIGIFIPIVFGVVNAIG